MSLSDYVTAVEAGFRAYANGDAEIPLPTHLAAGEGTFHAKSARLTLDRPYVALKLNGNFPGNPQKSGLPTIQGVVVLCDGTDGTVLALLDSIEVTLRRTAAATALAARFLAPADCDALTLCGCGAQGRAQLEALADAMAIQRVFVWDADASKARAFARDMSQALAIDARAVDKLREATLQSRLIVTATTARTPFLAREMVVPGSFVAAVGADNSDKSELGPDLMAEATIVADLITQASAMGDLHHAIAAGVLTARDVYAELADLVVGRKAGRTNPEQTFVFDSTGTAIQDVASAVAIWRRAEGRDVGSSIHLGAL
jgi:ornithine cyclodeaminase/alanine dehydrogenase-like protein (mu-crystallin family)